MDTSASFECDDVNPHRSVPRRGFLGNLLAGLAGGTLGANALADAYAPPSERPQTAANRANLQPNRLESPMQDAIKACLDCHSMCLRMAMTYCLEKGGRHVEQNHLRLMFNCAEMCQTSANFMLSDSPMHGRVCLICAETCEACAESCEQVGEMRDCVDECLRCAKSCRSMS